MIPDFFYQTIDNCLDGIIDAAKLDTVLISSVSNTMKEKETTSKSLNVLDYINIHASFNTIKNIIKKNIEIET